MSRGRILVIRGGAIGDFILTLPVFSALRLNFPETDLHVLGYPHIAKVAELGGIVHGVRSIEAQALAGFFVRGGKLSDELAAYFSSFAIIISYLYDPDGIFQGNVARCTKAQFIAGPHRPNENENLHATEVFLKPLQRLAIFDADPTPRLTLDCPRPALEVIAVHPGSGSEKKNWPEEKWSELLRELASTTQHNVLLIGGESEGEKTTRLARVPPTGRCELARNLPLTELAQHLAKCALFIGHDSGITHLAAAVGVKGLVLWGESNANIWRPGSDRMKIIHAERGLPDLSVSCVLDETRQLIAG